MGLKNLLSLATSSKTPRAKLIRRTLVAVITLGLSYVGITGQLAEDISDSGATMIITTMGSDTGK